MAALRIRVAAGEAGRSVLARAGLPSPALEAEDEHEGVVDGTLLVRVEAAGRWAQALWIDDGRLLDEHACL